MGKKTNADVIRIVGKWQKAGIVHELTCAADSGHQALVPVEIAERVVLLCPTCGKVRENIPDFVLGAEEALDFSARVSEEERKADELRHQRQDRFFYVAFAASVGCAIGGLWGGAVYAIMFAPIGGVAAWIASIPRRSHPQ